MGQRIDRDVFNEQDYEHFGQRLASCLAALSDLLDRPGFGVGPASVGAELELFLVDGAGRPLRRNEAVRAAAADPRVTLEIDRFNLELNSSPTRLAGHPFTTLGDELSLLLERVGAPPKPPGAGWLRSASCPLCANLTLVLTRSPTHRATSRSTAACGGCVRSPSGSGLMALNRWSWLPMTWPLKERIPRSRSTYG